MLFLEIVLLTWQNSPILCTIWLSLIILKQTIGWLFILTFSTWFVFLGFILLIGKCKQLGKELTIRFFFSHIFKHLVSTSITRQTWIDFGLFNYYFSLIKLISMKYYIVQQESINKVLFMIEYIFVWLKTEAHPAILIINMRIRIGGK